MNKVHIVDGNNFFSRHYFTNARSLDKILERFCSFINKNKGRIIACFDTTKSERRLNLYPEYKAGRKSSLSEEEYKHFKETLSNFIEVVRNMNISVLDGYGYEADDYIAILVKMLKRYHVFIHSTDQDFYQLVSDRTTVTWYKKDEDAMIKLTPENFAEIVGVEKEFFLDYKCMVGDTSDNIPGIEGIGPGKAKKYINMYGYFEDIVDALKPKLNETKKKNQPNVTETKILNGHKAFNLARTLIDCSEVYNDRKLKNLVREMVGKTALDYKKILVVLSDCDCEEVFETVRFTCQAKARKK